LLSGNPTYRLLSEKPKEFLSSILSSRGIVPHSIASREKDPEELREKITREGEVPGALFNNITDLAGVRIIAYFPSDVDKIVPLIEKEFTVDCKHSRNKNAQGLW
jgi:ppGpp synthetase/RelA/SpoT-type nucleotidyltranferase